MLRPQSSTSSEVNRSDAMSGAASGSGPGDEERAVDVLALPTPDPLSIDFSFPSFSWNALPSWGAIRQTRPDRQQEVVEGVHHDTFYLLLQVSFIFDASSDLCHVHIVPDLDRLVDEG